MKLLQLSVFIIFFTSTTLFSQSFYVLTGVDTYDPLITSPDELEIYNEDILEEMKEMSKELNVNIANHPSRVLAFIITKFSLGEDIGYRIELELGEYMKREGVNQSVFALSYLDILTIVDSEDIEDALIDATDEMLTRFRIQYKDDNKDMSKSTEITHKNFASVMKYDTKYTVAIERAKKEGKNLFIFMSTTYCPWCRKMEKQVLTKSDVDKKIQANYTPLMLDFSRKHFPKQFRKIAFTPTLYIVDPKTEKIIHQFVGYAAKSEFLHMLNKK